MKTTTTTTVNYSAAKKAGVTLDDLMNPRDLDAAKELFPGPVIEIVRPSRARHHFSRLMRLKRLEARLDIELGPLCEGRELHREIMAYMVPWWFQDSAFVDRDDENEFWAAHEAAKATWALRKVRSDDADRIRKERCAEKLGIELYDDDLPF